MDEASVRIDATPERVWALVSDVTGMGRWSPGSTGGRWILGASGPAVGAHFLGFNRRGPMRWATSCTVVECARPSRFVFDVDQNKMRWGFTLEPADGGGTLLTQRRERVAQPLPPVRWFAHLLFRGKVEEEMVEGMTATLSAIKAEAESGTRP